MTLKYGGTNKWNCKEISSTLKLLIIFSFLNDLETNWVSPNAELSPRKPVVYMDIHDMYALKSFSTAWARSQDLAAYAHLISATPKEAGQENQLLTSISSDWRLGQTIGTFGLFPHLQDGVWSYKHLLHVLSELSKATTHENIQ